MDHKSLINRMHFVFMICFIYFIFWYYMTRKGSTGVSENGEVIRTTRFGKQSINDEPHIINYRFVCFCSTFFHHFHHRHWKQLLKNRCAWCHIFRHIVLWLFGYFCNCSTILKQILYTFPSTKQIIYIIQCFIYHAFHIKVHS